MDIRVPGTSGDSLPDDLAHRNQRRSLTLASAPAGFGKTTLLASWAAHTPLPVAWFSIDDGDNDPARFAAYLIAALGSILPPEVSERFQAFIQSLTQAFTHTLQPSIQPMLIQLVNHLAAERAPFVLILDDFQFIHSPVVHQALAFLLEKLPACMHLVIATRSDPPISLARLRARDQLVEIRMSDLRFSFEESAGFLVQTSILERFSSQLCDAVTGTEGSQPILVELEKENLFLVPLDSERRWYRYHHLFAELLRFKLEETLSMGSEPERQGLPCPEELHLRAANWLEQHRLFGEAIQHYTAARQYDQAAALIEDQAHTVLFTTGQIYTLLEWLAALPADIFRSRPRLSIANAWTLIVQNQFAAASEQIETTWEVVRDRQDAAAANLIGEIAILRGVLAKLSSRDVTDTLLKTFQQNE